MSEATLTAAITTALAATAPQDRLAHTHVDQAALKQSLTSALMASGAFGPPNAGTLPLCERAANIYITAQFEMIFKAVTKKNKGDAALMSPQNLAQCISRHLEGANTRQYTRYPQMLALVEDEGGFVLLSFDNYEHVLERPSAPDASGSFARRAVPIPGPCTRLLSHVSCPVSRVHENIYLFPCSREIWQVYKGRELQLLELNTAFSAEERRSVLAGLNSYFAFMDELLRDIISPVHHIRAYCAFLVLHMNVMMYCWALRPSAADPSVLSRDFSLLGNIAKLNEWKREHCQPQYPCLAFALRFLQYTCTGCGSLGTVRKYCPICPSPSGKGKSAGTPKKGAVAEPAAIAALLPKSDEDIDAHPAHHPGW